MEYAPFCMPIELYPVSHCNQFCRNCVSGCDHSNAKEEHQAEDYFPWLDEMKRRKIDIDVIRFTGGEPFLHSDLAGFIRKLKERYCKPIRVYSNCTWVFDIERHVDAISLIDELVFSSYPNVVAKASSIDDVLERIRRVNPRSRVSSWDGKETFLWMKTTSVPTTPRKRCPSFDQHCNVLTDDGRIHKCCIAASVRRNTRMTKEFKDACDHGEYYNLAVDDGASVQEWHEKNHLFACYFCSIWSLTAVEWEQVSVKSAENKETGRIAGKCMVWQSDCHHQWR